MALYTKLTRPRLPRAAFLLEADEAAAVELRRKGNLFSLAAAARTPLPAGILVPSFDEPNVRDLGQLASALDATAQGAGLGRRQRWSVLLPEAAVKTLVISVESAPASREELREMINWKVERLVGAPADELRVSRQFIGSGRSPRFLVVAVRSTVIAEYEELFATLDWRAGLIVPRFVGEAAWLDWDASPGDKLLVGARGATCMAAFVRGGELMLVRSIDGDPARLEDEIYRLTLYFRDRIAEVPEIATVSAVMTYGAVDGERVAATVEDALGAAPALVEPVPSLLDPGSAAEIGPGLLAAAGLATQAWAV